MELGPGVADAHSGVAGSPGALEVVVDGSCMEDRWSDVGMWTWAACSKKEVQN